MNQTIQVEKLVDEQKIGRFNLILLILSFLAMLSDGYEITAMGFAAPELVRLWGIEQSTLGPVFSASLFGILFGAPLLGYVGDRLGRRSAIITGCIIYALSTLAMMWAHNLEQMTALRFITGIGIGGLMPNTISLTSELSPKRWRATLIVLMFTGVTLGNAMPGPAAAWLVPQYGWQVLFLIGGTVPLGVAVALYFALPESVKFLTLQPGRRAELLRMARRLRPDLAIPDDARFVIAPAGGSGGVGLAQIFGGGLAWITPLLWLCFATALMANYFLNSWMPLLFQENGMPPEQAAIASTMYNVGGTVGGLLLSMMLDRFGFIAIAVLFALAGPAIAAVGMSGIPHATMAILSAAAGFAVLGAQFGNNASAGLLYPTAFRSKGVGWALAIGRFGSILGPLIGGVLIGMGLPVQQLFVIAAMPMVIGVAAALLLARLCYLRFGSHQLDDTPAARETSAAADVSVDAQKPVLQETIRQG